MACAMLVFFFYTVLMMDKPVRLHKPIRVVIADDHALVLEGLRSLLAGESDIRVIATATDGERLLDAVNRFHPDVVITDIRMPYMDGLTSLKEIRRVRPATRVLLLTAYTDEETLQTAVSSDADGLLLKTDPPQQTIHAIRQVMAGQLVFPAAARRWLFQPPVTTQPSIQLSEREQDVLKRIAQGMSNGMVAQQLQISVSTVKFHLQNIYRTLNVRNRTEAGHWYLKHRP